jgi:hypothetical protein
MEKVPIRPNTDTSDFMTIKREDGSLIAWYSDGVVLKVNVDGMIKLWYAKPTLNDAITRPNYINELNYSYQFHSNGSVTARYKNSNYYWSAPMSGIPESGEKIYSTYLYNFRNDYENDESDDYNEEYIDKYMD